MSIRLEDYFSSGWSFSESQKELKSRYQMANIALFLSGFAYSYGVIVNIMDNALDLVYIESAFILSNIILFFLLRRSQKLFELIIQIITIQGSFLLVYIIYTLDFSTMKYLWIFTYPIVLLYFQKNNNGIYWTVLLIVILFVSPLQNFFPVQHTIYQTTYISVVLGVLAIIVFFYQKKMIEAKDVILQQQELLKKQLEDLTRKDQLLSTQSKQAVMGEMISMIAHQWRQPLSTVTLSVSNLQVKKLLGDSIEDKDLDKALEDISDTVVYLSNTIDDFQTYFHPTKEISKINIFELLQKAVNFVLPRLKDTKIYIELDNKKHKDLLLNTYMNELIQVVLNILNNAIDALILSHRENPHIVISVEEKEDSVLIIIKDNASGIKKEDINQIFEPYFSTKGKNGTGLGLYMSQMIVQKQFNGTIDVMSSKKGTCFSVEIQKILS